MLAVDLDPQGNLSDYFDVPPDASPTIGDVLAGRAKAPSAVHAAPDAGEPVGPPVHVVPANLALAEAELLLAARWAASSRCARRFKLVDDDHDIVLIDCPPALGLLTVNALVAADFALLSSEAQYFALQGVEQALEVIELARDGLNPDLEWLGVFFNIADMRTVHSREAFDFPAASTSARSSSTRRPSVDRVRELLRARHVDPRPPSRPRCRLPAA